MEISISQEQGKVPVSVLHVKGDLRSEDELLSQARTAFESGTRNILLDLSGVRFMSSSGLRAIHKIFNMLRTDAPNESDEAVSAGITAGTFTSPHLKILKPQKNVLEVLKLAGYDMFLEIHQNYKKAIDSF